MRAYSNSFSKHVADRPRDRSVMLTGSLWMDVSARQEEICV